MSIENVVRVPSTATPKNLGGDFPALKWDPETGECREFTKAGDVPAGWLNTHPNNLPKAEKVEPAPLPLSRKEVLKALKDGGIEFAASADHRSLYDLLLQSVKASLTEAGIAFDAESTDAKELLGLFPAS